MEQEYTPFEVIALCKCELCNTIANYTATLNKLTGELTLKTPADWHFNPERQRYECNSCYDTIWEGEDVAPNY